MISIFKDKKIILTILVCLVIIILTVIFVMKPLAKSSVKIYQDQKLKTRELELLKSNLDNLKQVDKELKDLAKVGKEAKIFLPDQENTGDFWTQLQILTAISDNDITSIGPKIIGSSESTASQAATKSSSSTQSTQATQTAKKLFNIASTNETGTQLKLAGNYSQLYAFLEGLEKLALANTVSGIKISSANGKLQTTLDIISFYMTKK